MTLAPLFRSPAQAWRDFSDLKGRRREPESFWID